MQSKNFGYIPALDHLRGFAALLVPYFHGSHFIYHKIVFGTPYEPVNWPLAGNPLSALGTVSYSIYLAHFVVLNFFMERNLDTLLQVQDPIGTAVLNVAVLTYFCIDRPFLVRRRAYMEARSGD